MAVNVGNLDQCIVLLQTWTLMRKLSSTEQTYEYMEAIAEMVTMQVFDKPPNDEEYLFLKGTDIPLYAVYMHCAFHTKRTIMQNKYQFKYEKDNALQKYNATMSEAYTFYFKRHPRNHKVCLLFPFTTLNLSFPHFLYTIRRWSTIGLKTPTPGWRWDTTLRQPLCHCWQRSPTGCALSVTLSTRRPSLQLLLI